MFEKGEMIISDERGHLKQKYNLDEAVFAFEKK